MPQMPRMPRMRMLRFRGGRRPWVARRGLSGGLGLGLGLGFGGSASGECGDRAESSFSRGQSA